MKPKTLPDLIAIIAVCMVVFAALPLGLAAGQTASGGFDDSDSLTKWNGKTTSFTAGLVSSGEIVDDSSVVTYGSDGRPGWYIWYDTEDEDAFANIEQWVGSSDDRRVIEHDADSGRVLVASPVDHIRRTSWLGFRVDGLTSRSFVESVELEQRVDLVEPVSTKSIDQVESENGPTGRAQFLASLGGGSFGVDDGGAAGVAYDDDVNRTNMSSVRESISADRSSLPSSADGSSTTYAVLDTGANVGQEGTTRGVVFGNGSVGSTIRIEHGRDFVSGASINTSAGNYSAIADGNLHGTYTAARIGGAAAGDQANRSPAYASELAIGRVLDDSGSGSIQTIIDGLEWSCGPAVDADVVSLSLGSAGYSRALNDEIHECLTDEDVSAVVVAAGNSRWTTGRTNVGSPADADGVIAVAATTSESPDEVEIAYFGNVGPDDGIKDGSGGATRLENPDVGSPGMKNTVVGISSTGAKRSITLSGTSMSTPDVAMSAGLIVDENPGLRGDHEAVRERLLESASPAPNIGTTEIGHGLLNVSNAIDDTRPTTDQEDARTEQAKARDQANQALAGDIASWIKSRGLEI